jgi:hypothetical protein
MKRMDELLKMTNYSTRYTIEEFCKENNITDVDDFIMTEITEVINEDTTTKEWKNIYRTSENQTQKIKSVRETTINLLKVVLGNVYETYDVKDYIMMNIVNNPSEELLKMRDKVV